MEDYKVYLANLITKGQKMMMIETSLSIWLLVISVSVKYSQVSKMNFARETEGQISANHPKCCNWLLIQGKTQISMIEESKWELIDFRMSGVLGASFMNFWQVSSFFNVQIIFNFISES